MFKVLLTLSTVALTLLISSESSANPEIFRGKWNGKGTYIFQSDVTQCSTVELIFDATPSSFKFAGGERICDKHTERFYPVTMNFTNGGIYFGAQKIGSYTATTLEASYRMPDGNSFRNWRMFMRREGNHLMYEESRTMEGETTPLISFAGVLKLETP